MLTEGNIKALKLYCAGDITTIEGYWEAFNDESHTRYCCHHREEIQHDGTEISKQQLIDEHRYYKVEPDMLVIMEIKEHNSIHHKGKNLSDEHKLAIIEYATGHKHSDETKQKMSLARKGKPKPKRKWLTPAGDIREMCMNTAKQFHPDWVLLS